MRRVADALERLAVALVLGVALSSTACILGPKQDDPDQYAPESDATTGADGAKADPETGVASDSGPGAFDTRPASDAVGPPDNRCGDDGGDAGDADLGEAGCDGGPIGDGATDADVPDGDAPNDGVTGG